MKLAGKLFIAMLVASAAASAMDPKVLRLIGPETRVVMGVDVERYSTSALRALHPADLEWVLAHSGMDHLQQVISVTGNPQAGRPLLVLLGTGLRDLPQPTSEEGAPPASVETYRGHAIRSNDRWGSQVRLDKTTAILGEAAMVRGAIDRWSRQDDAASGVAARADRLSGTYDIWFLAVRPLELSLPEGAKPLKYRDELVRVIEEVRGGVRLGSLNQMTAEVVARTADDAVTLAALGRWLPGLMQLNERNELAVFVELAESFAARVEGRSAVLSVSIPEAAILKMTERERCAFVIEQGAERDGQTTEDDRLSHSAAALRSRSALNQNPAAAQASHRGVAGTS